MKKFPTTTKVPYLFGILCIALAAVITLQIVWMFKSKELIEEQFDQKVNLAMGSALSDFNASHQSTLSTTDFQACGPVENTKCISQPFYSPEEQEELEVHLKESMQCYGIEDNYSVQIYDETCAVSKNEYCCALPANGNGAEGTGSKIGVSFMGREDYMIEQMRPMVLSSIGVFILLASVCFIILGALVKQKRITANNIDFFNNTAHELQTPLTNIKLAFKLLTKKHKELSDDKYAEIIRAENSRLADQIERVLFLSKMENGEYSMEKKIIEIESVLEEVAEDMALAVNEKNGRIKLNFGNARHQIMGDPYHLANVFRNLIDNAIKYCNKAPEIEISVTENQKHIMVEVSDNGIGVSLKDQRHIFEKFQRVNTGNVRWAKGFGIGLSYVKTVIELHKGFVQVKSELNKGSRFQLMIPNA